MDSLVTSLIEEWKTRSVEIQNDEVVSLYFGGGTPSLLKHAQLGQIINQVLHHCTAHPSIEITLEVNPDDINKKSLAIWKALGVNRLSIGIQSFDPVVLRWMNRAHDATQAINALHLCQDSGINNFNLDIIYGHQKYGQLTFAEDIQQFLYFKPKHISAYALTIEPKTLLYHQLQNSSFTPPEQEIILQDYLTLHETLGEFGMNHYELSNFAMPGFESKHNSNYWKGLPYIGIGPSAHSYDGKNKRAWNVSNNALYIQYFCGKDTSIQLTTTEFLSPRQQANEYWMTGLRTAKGVCLDVFQQYYSMSLTQHQYSKIKQRSSTNHLIIDGNTITCSPEGWMLLDAILSDLFFDSEE